MNETQRIKDAHDALQPLITVAFVAQIKGTRLNAEEMLEGLMKISEVLRNDEISSGERLA